MSGSVAALASSWLETMLVDSFYAAVVFAVVAVLCRTGRRLSPGLRHGLWMLVLLRLLLPPDVSHPFSAGAVLETMTLSAGPLAGGVGIDGGSLPGHTGPTFLSPRAPAPLWKIGLASVWLAGLGVVLGAHARRRRAWRQIVRSATEVSASEVRSLVAALRRRLRILRPVRVVTSEASVSPCATGILRPVVFLPTAVLADPRLLQPVLAHELAHVARWDSLWLCLEQVVLILYFFHPLVWITSSRLDLERERACDRLVISGHTVTPRAYARCLLEVLRLGLHPAWAPRLGSQKRRIAVRITTVFETKRQREPRTLAAVAATAILGFFLLPLAGDEGPRPPAAPPAASAVLPIVSGTQRRTPIELDHPLPGARLTWGWGQGIHPFSREVVFHQGVDLAAPLGTPVRAPAAGRVEVATADYEILPSAGTVLVIDHGGGWSTFYSHLDTLSVAAGERVTRGAVVATVGSTGLSTGPHVHFEVRANGEPVNPAELLPDLR